MFKVMFMFSFPHAAAAYQRQVNWIDIVRLQFAQVQDNTVVWLRIPGLLHTLVMLCSLRDVGLEFMACLKRQGKLYLSQDHSSNNAVCTGLFD